MQKKLPARPSLDHIKAQAKELLSGAKNADPDALARFQAQLPAARGTSKARLAEMPLALHDAQSVVAREYGFASFAQLRSHVASIGARAPSPELPHALMQRHMAVPPPDEVHAALLAAARPAAVPLPSLAEAKPVLPVRNALLTQGAVAPFHVGRPSSVAAIEYALRGDRSLAVFSQRNENQEYPGFDGLHAVGCIAHVCAFMRDSERGNWVVLKALAWVRLESLESASDHTRAHVSEVVIHEDDSAEIAELHARLLEHLRAAASGLPDPTRAREIVQDMSPLELADAAIANVYSSVEAKAHYASLTALSDRLRSALALMTNTR